MKAFYQHNNVFKEKYLPVLDSGPPYQKGKCKDGLEFLVCVMKLSVKKIQK